MNSIANIIKNIRNLLPYFILISIYFFFVNIEAKKEKNNKPKNDTQNVQNNIKSKSDVKNMRIKIPIIPYNE